LEKHKDTGTIKKKSTFREYAEAAAIAVLLALFIRTFVVQAFKIPSGSMEPTLLVGDHILVNKFIYGVKVPFARTTLIPIREPDREDVVVFIYPEDPSKDFIKRVIGLPGDTIRIRGRGFPSTASLLRTAMAFSPLPAVRTALREHTASALSQFLQINTSSWATTGITATTAASGDSCRRSRSRGRHSSSIGHGRTGSGFSTS
jgi:hypothetical protein